MRRAFQAFLTLFGVIVIAISLAHMTIGPQAIIGGVAVNPTMAGGDRFFAGLFSCYGIALLWCARDVQRKRVYVNLLAAAFFLGGIGRSPASRGPNSQSCSTAHLICCPSRCSCSSWHCRH
jgi:Domain of unknown function (DUF4345)